jgi:Fe-Mn family superoxide dismutase
MTFELPQLPYALDALAPHISKETLEFHYGKHHLAYVTKTNELIAGTDDENKSLEDLIKTSDGPLFNNAAQIWNHTFYWESMTPNNGGGAPQGEVLEAINSAFGSYDSFKSKFAEAGTTQFGSGWAWLVQGDKGLEIVKTANADNPLKNGDKPLLTLDVWEHAYYTDFRNARPNYISTFIDSLINWEFVAKNMVS